MTQWEYRTLVCPLDILIGHTVTDPADEEEIGEWNFSLASAGQDGWEMVGVASDQHKGLALCFFKRPRNGRT